MSWILFSLLAACTWAVGNVIDKFILSKLTVKPKLLVVVLGILGLPVGGTILIANGLPTIGIANLGFALLAAVCFLLFVFLYFKATRLNEISRIAPLFKISTIYTVILGALVLGEVFNVITYVGIALIILGSIGLSINNKRTKVSINKGFWFMLASGVFVAFLEVLTKILTTDLSYWTAFGYIELLTAVLVIPLVFMYYKQLHNASPKEVGAMAISQSMGLVGRLFLTIAIALGPVSLVKSVASIHAVFVLILMAGMSALYPSILKEENTPKNIMIKLITVVAIVAGAILVITN